MTQPSSLSPAPPIGFGPGGPLPAPAPWLIYNGYIGYVAGGVVVGTPAGGNTGPGTINTEGLFVNGQPLDTANFLPLTGGILTGPLTVMGGTTLAGLNVSGPATIAGLNGTGTTTLANLLCTTATIAGIQMTGGVIDGATLDMGTY